MKILQNLFFTFLLILVTPVFSQSSNYAYQEEFSSKGNWPTGNNSTRELSVYNGRYYFEHKRKKESWKVTTREFNLNMYQDFEIETSIQKISGVQDYGTTFMYDYKDNDNYRELGFTSTGYFRVAESVGGKYKNLKSWTKSSALKTGNYATNILKISKKGNTITFYVNGSYVYSTTHKNFMGKKMAFMLYRNQKISIDYVRAKQGSSYNNNNNIKKTTSKSILFEGFTNNNNKWSTGSSKDHSLAISGGDYIFEHKRASGSWLTWTKKYINTSRNFYITAQFKKISGINNNGFGLVFGRKDNDNQNQFFISSNGYYMIKKEENGKVTNLRNWTKSSTIKTGNGQYNYLKIQKEGSAYKFYINNTLVYTSYSIKFYDQNTGFVVYNKQKISIGYLSMMYTDDGTNNDNNNNNIDNVTIVDNISNYRYNDSDFDFSDQFNDNKNGWSIKNDNVREFTIDDGKYYLNHKRTEKGYLTYKDTYIDTNRDFEIEAKIDKISGVTNYAYGLLFGGKGKDEFRFYISSGGYYKYSRIVDDKEQNILKWTKTSVVNTGNSKSNVLKIRKENDQLKLYVNGTYLAKTDFEDFYGNNLGFSLFNKQVIAIDYLRVKYISNNNIIAKKISAPLRDDFSYNTNKWILENQTNYSVDMSNSKLLIHRKTKGGIFISREVNIDTYKDFVIETSISHTNTSSGYYGFTFGRKNSSNEFSFLLSGNGSYKYRKFENDQYKEIIANSFSSAINKGTNEANVIKLVKSGSILRFYINGQYVNETPFEKFYGDKIGYTVYHDRKIAVDYLDIKYQTEKFNSPPIVEILEPRVERGFKVVKTKRILVKGKATDADGIFEIMVNGVEANYNPSDGIFTASVPLKYGENKLIVNATDMKQSKSNKEFEIIRESPNNNETIVDNNIKKPEKLDVGFGKYYALIIGVSDYEDPKVQDLLGEPTKDAEALADVLNTYYNFPKSNITILKNPTAADIKRNFVILRKKVTKNDNVLIFYAGHGNYNKQMEYGYWMPADVQMEFEENIVLNTEIVTYLRTIKSKNTLLISDACFSGSILVKSRAYKDASKAVQIKHDTESRRAITSGTLTTVPNKSIFMKYLLKLLRENKEPYFSASDIYQRLEVAVLNNGGENPQKPVYAPISQTGDMGGDFYFIKKN